MKNLNVTFSKLFRLNLSLVVLGSIFLLTGAVRGQQKDVSTFDSSSVEGESAELSSRLDAAEASSAKVQLAVEKASLEAKQAMQDAADAKKEVADLKRQLAEQGGDNEKPVSMGYDKGFFMKDTKDLFLLKINARMQARYTLESLDMGEGEDREIESNFSMPAARLKLKGHVISKKVTYAFQTDFGKGNALLKDFYADFAFVKNKLHLRVGQWVKPFSRQQITSSGKLELNGRAITDKRFGAGRDIGLAVHNNYEKSNPVEWALGVFNGTGEKPWFKGAVDVDADTGELGDVTGKFSNVPDKFNPMVVARAGFNLGKLKGYSEADLEGGAPRFGLAVSGILDFDADDSDDGNIRAEVDYILKANGFSHSAGLYVASAQDGADFGEQAYHSMGLHAQAGYLIADVVQPVFRYAVFIPDVDDTNTQEIIGGLSIYFSKHNLKWQTEAGGIVAKDEGNTTKDIIARTQLQLAF